MRVWKYRIGKRNMNILTLVKGAICNIGVMIPDMKCVQYFWKLFLEEITKEKWCIFFLLRMAIAFGGSQGRNT